MTEWRKCRKKPVTVEFREPKPDVKVIIEGSQANAEIICTLEGTLYAIQGKDYVIRGIIGELYPIRKTIFEETYEVINNA
jgi:hypothetical protein